MRTHLRLCIPARAAMALLFGASPALATVPSELVGQYDGGQMEIAAGLELRADGHFHYEFAYGALDEDATGTWSVDGDRLVLASDPFKPPRFVVVSRGPGDRGVLRVQLDFKDPYDQQNFDALITRADGDVENVQLGIDGLKWEYAADAPPRSLRMLIPVYDIAGEPLALDPAPGTKILYHFEPNDIGKVDLRDARFTIDKRDIVYEHLGRTISFRRVAPRPADRPAASP